MGILITIASVVLVFFYTLLLTEDGLLAGFASFVDIPSLLILLLLVIPILISAGMLKDFRASFRRAFSDRVSSTRAELQRSMEAVALAIRANWTAGVFGFFISFVYICRSYAAEDTKVFWMNLSVGVIPFIYAAMLNLILLAVHGRLKRRCIDYVGEDAGTAKTETRNL